MVFTVYVAFKYASSIVFLLMFLDSGVFWVFQEFFGYFGTLCFSVFLFCHPFGDVIA